MTQSAAPQTICVVSSNAIASIFLSKYLKDELQVETYVAAEYLQQPCTGGRLLMVLDCTQLNVPLSKYIGRSIMEHPGALVIVIDSQRTESEIGFLLSLGVHGFVLFDEINTSLVRATQSVMAGGVWTPTRNRPAARFSTGRNLRADINVLTYRELEVLELLRRRLSNKEIASTLRIKECTVKYHVSNLLGKLQLNRRLDVGVSTRKVRSNAEML